MNMRIVSGIGALDQVGALAEDLSITRALIVADTGIAAAGFAARAVTRLREAGILCWVFDAFGPNPDTAMIEAGRAVAAGHRIDGFVALGGGSSLDCAKGINFLVTNGGAMRDYRGHGKAIKPMLPSIGIPTTAGGGSEAQSFATICDPETGGAMACGDAKAAFRTVILDAELTVAQPREVTATSGYDAVSHAVEAFVTTTRTAASQETALQAWRLLEANYERVLEAPQDIAARDAMLLGAHRAGVAVEMSMLGAAHACAHPLTAKYGTTHGIALAVMLSHVVRWNAEVVGEEYKRLWDGDLAGRLDALARNAGLPRTLGDLGAAREEIDALAAAAAAQWTAQHNPRPFDKRAAMALYESAV